MPMCWRARCSMLRRIQTRQPARAGASAARPSFRASHATLRADLASSWKALFRSTAARHRIEAAKARTDMREWQIKRRERTRQLIELGGLVAKADLVELTDDDRAALYGAFLTVAAKLRSEERRVGKEGVSECGTGGG